MDQPLQSRPLWLVHGLMFCNASLVATSFTVGKAIASGLDPAVLSLLRFIAATLLLCPFLLFRQELKRPPLAALGRYGLISLSIVLFFWLMFWSLRYTSAFNTSVIFTLVPGISGIYSALLLRERLSSTRIIALLLATTGALWVVFQGDLHRLLGLEGNRGDLLFFLGCLTMAAYPPLVKLLHRGESMLVMTFWVLLTACGWLTLLCLYRLPGIAWHAAPGVVWLGILYLALFCTVITFYLTKICTLRLGPTRVMAYSFLYPPLVIGLDLLFGKPFPAARTWLGVLIILPAMLVLQRGAISGQNSTAQPG